jgi:hypothetical protein
MVGHRQAVINPHFTHYPRAITKLGRELVTEEWTQCDEEIGSKKSFHTERPFALCPDTFFLKSDCTPGNKS